MIRNNTTLAILETLLNSLAAEKHHRPALLDTVVDELTTTNGLEAEARKASRLREEVAAGELSDTAFIAAVRELCVSVQGRLGDRGPLESRPRLVPDEEPSSGDLAGGPPRTE